MSYRFLLPFLLSFLFVFQGCGGPAKPTDFPDLVKPVTIKVHKNDVPLQDVTVILHQKETELPFLITGRTDKNGVAMIKTSRNTYVQPGAPKGTFCVQLTEFLMIDIDPLPRDATRQQEIVWEKKYQEEAARIRTFPKILTSAADSPLEVNITTSPVVVEFDVSKYLDPSRQ